MKLIDHLFPSHFARRSLASHLGDVFAIAPGHLEPAVEEARARLATMTATDIRALASASSERVGLMVREGSTAIIPVVGTIVRGDASCAREFGMNATGLGEIETALRAAAADATITDVVMAFDSPGGTGTGLASVSALIGAVRVRKPVRAVVHGLCASAAYWLASACESIEAEPSALVGSIGVYSVIEDSSKMAEAVGVKVHVLRSHELKGAGVPGAPVTSAQLASAQRVVDEFAALFVAQVAQGRSMAPEAARAVATGEVWTAGEAMRRGLIDSLATVELEAMADAAPAFHAGGIVEGRADEARKPLLAGDAVVSRDVAERLRASTTNTITPPAFAGEHHAPPGAITEEGMEKATNPVAAVDAGADTAKLLEQLAEARARAEKAEAIAASFAAAKKASVEKTKADAIERHALAATFPPAERPSIETLAQVFGEDADGFVAHLDARAAVSGSVVRPTPAGKTPDEPDADAQIDAIDRQLAEAMRTTPEAVRLAASSQGVSQSHEVIAADGRRIQEVK